MNIPLKVAIVQSGRSQNEIAAAAHMSSWRLSKIINGHAKVTPAERRRLARVLRRRVSEVFEVAA